MADIYQCPRCGAVTYREGITIHDRYHAERDREQADLIERIEDADVPQLRNWPTPQHDVLEDTAEEDAAYVADEPQAAPSTRSW